MGTTKDNCECITALLTPHLGAIAVVGVLLDIGMERDTGINWVAVKELKLSHHNGHI